MNINSAQFILGITQEQSLSQGLVEENFPHFAVIGRSNVGKSSFINTITNKKDLAYSGSRPGVTQQINLFLLNRKIYLDDMPGYGYAKISFKERKKLEDLIFWYFKPAKENGAGVNLVKVFQLVDALVGPTQLDLMMGEFLINQKFKTIIVANKIDKIKQSQIHRSLTNIKNLFHGMKVIPFSSKTGEGKKEILKEFE